MKRPRDFWIIPRMPNVWETKPTGELSQYHTIHVREVVEIDWERVWDTHNLKCATRNYITTEQQVAIKELIEKQLRGED